MNKLKGCMSHLTDNWKTPSDMFDLLVKKYHFIDCFEYCSNLDQYEKLYRYRRLFINPPYSQLRTNKFINYINELINEGNIIVLLVPSRTDTKWFYELFFKASYIRFIKGRLHFNDSKYGAPFPSCLMFFNVKDLESPFAIYTEDYKSLLETLDMWCFINKYDVN